MPREHVQEHIDLIAKHEQEFFQNRTATERAGDAIASFAGSLKFVGLHLFGFAVWMLVNTLPATRGWRFDPYPFAMLDTVVAIEAILLASFILMRQARTSRRSDERDHLILQVLLLTEKEVTALLQATRKIAAHHGMENVTRDRDLAALARETPIDEVAETIKESLPQEP